MPLRLSELSVNASKRVYILLFNFETKKTHLFGVVVVVRGVMGLRTHCCTITNCAALWQELIASSLKQDKTRDIYNFVASFSFTFIYFFSFLFDSMYKKQS